MDSAEIHSRRRRLVVRTRDNVRALTVLEDAGYSVSEETGGTGSNSNAAAGRVEDARLAAALCPLVFFVTSTGRGYLGALGFVAYVPWAVPALYSGIGSEVGGSPGPLSYLLVVFTGLVGFIGTILWWNYADQTD